LATTAFWALALGALMLGSRIDGAGAGGSNSTPARSTPSSPRPSSPRTPSPRPSPLPEPPDYSAIQGGGADEENRERDYFHYAPAPGAGPR